MVGVGALIGLPMALGLTRLLTAYLFGLTPQDPSSIVSSVLGLLAVTCGSRVHSGTTRYTR